MGEPSVICHHECSLGVYMVIDIQPTLSVSPKSFKFNISTIPVVSLDSR